MPKQLPNIQAKSVTEPKANDPKATLATGIIQAQKAFQDCIPVVVDGLQANADAQEMSRQVTDDGHNKRATLISDYADLAIKLDLTDAHIAEGVKRAITVYGEGKNAKASSLSQFKSELLRGTSVAARGTIRADFAHAYALWAEERDAEKSAKENNEELPPSPLREAFKRAYHMVVGTTGIAAARAGELGDTGVIMADDPLELANHVIVERGIDPKLAAKAVKRAVAEIERIRAEFPHHRFATVIGYLQGIDTDALMDVYVKAHPDAAKPGKAPKPAVVPVRKVTPKPEPTMTDEETLAATDTLTGEPAL